MGYPGIPKIGFGRDYNFFQKVDVTWSTFGGGSTDGIGPDILITFPTQTIMLLNESSSGVVEYSFNGYSIHGELDSTLPSRALTFDNRRNSLIWFRVKSGSSGPIRIRTDSWGTP